MVIESQCADILVFFPSLKIDDLAILICFLSEIHYESYCMPIKSDKLHVQLNLCFVHFKCEAKLKLFKHNSCIR